MKRFLQFTVSLVCGGLVLYAALRQFDLRPTAAAIRQTRLNLLILGLALIIAAYLLRGARWRIWESSLSYWDSLRLILIGFAANNVLLSIRWHERIRFWIGAANLKFPAHMAFSQTASRPIQFLLQFRECRAIRTEFRWPHLAVAKALERTQGPAS